MRADAIFGLLALAAAPRWRAQYSLSKARQSGIVTRQRASAAAGRRGYRRASGQPVDLNLTFTAENGYPVRLGEYFHKGRPVILNLVYYNCPMLCTLILNGQTEAMREIPWTPGNEYEVVTISIDPRESFDVRAEEESRLPGQLRSSGAGLAFSGGPGRQRASSWRKQVGLQLPLRSAD